MTRIYANGVKEESGWLPGQYCVVCAREITQEEADAAQGCNIAGCCKAHRQLVIDEMEFGYPMWPSHWYGQWWLTATRGWYTQRDLARHKKWVAENGGE